MRIAYEYNLELLLGILICEEECLTETLMDEYHIRPELLQPNGNKLVIYDGYGTRKLADDYDEYYEHLNEKVKVIQIY